MIKLSKARFQISMIFLVGLILQFILYLSGIIGGQILMPYFGDLTLSALKVFSVPIAVVTSFKLSRSANKLISKQEAGIAMAACILWNVLVLLPSALLLARKHTMEDTMEYQELIRDYGSFLVAGVLAYFFSSSVGKS